MSTDVLSEKIKQIKLQGNLPRHVAIIMDGNGRWAVARKRPRIYGHGRGAKSVKAVVEAAGEVNVEVLTLFAFSEENWGRPKVEVTAIMKLLERYVVQERENLDENNVRFRTIGSLDRLPETTRRAVLETEEYLKNNTGLTLNIALSYGGRNEIALTCRKIAERVASGELPLEAISPDLISENLMTAGLPDPDLVIRTSGEYRISNFLLWQLAYAELYFTSVHWPDFQKAHFLDAIEAYQIRTRRYGLIGAEASSCDEMTSASAPEDFIEDGVGC
jgi:undecaprenyl diphosphate synthase